MVQQNGEHDNGFAPLPVVDAPYAMRPEDNGAVYPARAITSLPLLPSPSCPVGATLSPASCTR